MNHATKQSSQELPLFLKEPSLIFPEVSPTLLTSCLKPNFFLSLLIFFLVSACDLFPEEKEEKGLQSNGGGSTEDEAQQQQENLLPLAFFVGNSLTYNHDIPQRFNNLLGLNELKDSNYSGVQSDTAAARTLDSAFYSVAPKLLLKNIRPKFIILQEQSNGWSFNYTEALIQNYKSVASELGSTIILYQTWNKHWPGRDGWPQDCKWSGKSFPHSSVPKEYLEGGAKYSLAVAPVAETWEDACNKPLSVYLVLNTIIMLR